MPDIRPLPHPAAFSLLQSGYKYREGASAEYRRYTIKGNDQVVYTIYSYRWENRKLIGTNTKSGNDFSAKAADVLKLYADFKRLADSDAGKPYETEPVLTVPSLSALRDWLIETTPAEVAEAELSEARREYEESKKLRDDGLPNSNLGHAIEDLEMIASRNVEEMQRPPAGDPASGEMSEPEYQPIAPPNPKPITQPEPPVTVGGDPTQKTFTFAKRVQDKLLPQIKDIEAHLKKEKEQLLPLPALSNEDQLIKEMLFSGEPVITIPSAPKQFNWETPKYQPTPSPLIGYDIDGTWVETPKKPWLPTIFEIWDAAKETLSRGARSLVDKLVPGEAERYREKKREFDEFWKISQDPFEYGKLSPGPRGPHFLDEDAEAFTRSGILFVYKGFQLSKAKADFEHATELDPTYEPAWYNLGLVLAWLQDWSGSEKALQRYLGLGGSRSDLARQGIATGKRFLTAEQDKAQSSVLYARNYSQQANLLSGYGYYEAAIVSLIKGSQLKERDASFYLRAADILARSGNRTLAMKTLKSAVLVASPEIKKRVAVVSLGPPAPSVPVTQILDAISRDQYDEVSVLLGRRGDGWSKAVAACLTLMSHPTEEHFKAVYKLALRSSIADRQMLGSFLNCIDSALQECGLSPVGNIQTYKDLVPTSRVVTQVSFFKPLKGDGLDCETDQSGIVGLWYTDEEYALYELATGKLIKQAEFQDICGEHPTKPFIEFKSNDFRYCVVEFPPDHKAFAGAKHLVNLYEGSSLLQSKELILDPSGRFVAIKESGVGSSGEYSSTCTVRMIGQSLSDPAMLTVQYDQPLFAKFSPKGSLLIIEKLRAGSTGKDISVYESGSWRLLFELPKLEGDFTILPDEQRFILVNWDETPGYWTSYSIESQMPSGVIGESRPPEWKADPLAFIRESKVPGESTLHWGGIYLSDGVTWEERIFLEPVDLFIMTQVSHDGKYLIGFSPLRQPCIVAVGAS